MKLIISEINRLFTNLEEKYLSIINDDISVALRQEIVVDIQTLGVTVLNLLPPAASLESKTLAPLLDSFFNHLCTSTNEVWLQSLDGQTPSDKQLGSILDDIKQTKLRNLFLIELSKNAPLMTRLIHYSANTYESLKPSTLKTFASLKANCFISDALVENIINNLPKLGSAAEAIIDENQSEISRALGWSTTTRKKLDAAIEARSFSHHPDSFFNHSNDRDQNGYIPNSDSLKDWSYG